MKATTKDLRAWLQRRYHQYVVADEPRKGTYGLIWFLQDPRQETDQSGFAVKTLAPESVSDGITVQDVEYLKREFRMWLALPHAYNVVPALGVDVAPVQSIDGGEVVHLPIMRMPRLDGSLDDWIVGRPDIGSDDRLISLAQAFNGLLFLYAHGLEGHGDLKPSNILYSDIRRRFELPKRQGWPSDSHPWQIHVADLGWADAWVDFGFTTKALREYLAPERLDGHVVPQKSDMFAMGIVAAELLQGRHPANLKKVKRSEGEWRRWVSGGSRDLSGITSDHLRGLILRCLDSDPDRRPTPEECIHEVCKELVDEHHIEIESTLELWRQPLSPIDDAEHVAWAAVQSVELGSREASQSRRDLERRIALIVVTDFDSIERWMAFAQALRALLENEGPASWAKVIQLQRDALAHLGSVLMMIDAAILESIGRRENWPAQVQPFERLSMVVGGVAALAGVTYETASARADWGGSLAVAALAFAYASAAHAGGGGGTAEEHYLAEAIRLAPDEATSYYFRASWRYGRWVVQSVLLPDSAPHPNNARAGWRQDLETACRLAPDWSEARRLLDRLATSVE